MVSKSCTISTTYSRGQAYRLPSSPCEGLAVNSYFQKFVNGRLAHVSGCSVGLKLAYQNFLDGIDDRREKRLWPRWRFMAELISQGWTIDKYNGTDRLPNVSLLPPSFDRPQLSAMVDPPNTSAVTAAQNL